jgi:hypothetical protein
MGGMSTTGKFLTLGIVFVGLMGAFIYFMFTRGVHPKPVRVMKPTAFEQPEQIGAVIYRRLKFDLAEFDVIVFGTHKDIPQISFYKTTPWKPSPKSSRQYI